MLSKVGGLDIAGLAGVFLGGAAYGVPIVIDGFISSVAALAAVNMSLVKSVYAGFPRIQRTGSTSYSGSVEDGSGTYL